MADSVRQQLAGYLGDLFVAAGVVLLVFDVAAVVGAQPAGQGRVAADLALLAGGVLAHVLARTSLRDAPLLALTPLLLASLAVVWLTGRWWIPTAAGAATAALAPHFLPTRRALEWAGTGSLLGLAAVVASPTTAALAAGFVLAVAAASFRLAPALRGASSRAVAELERTMEAERLQAARVLAKLNRLESGTQRASRQSGLRTAPGRRFSVVQAIALTIVRDLKPAVAAAPPGPLTAAADRSVARAERLAQLAAGGETREQQTTLALIWPRVLAQLHATVTSTHHLEVALPDTVPPVCGATEVWVQMLASLVDNALEAMRGGGVVRVRVEASDRPGMARVTVQDTGPGFPPEILAHVLEPFHSSHRDTGAEGLGLATVASLVEVLEGEVRVASEPGAGALVEIEVPFAAAAAHPAAAEPMRLTGMVLVADNDREFRRVLARLLESLGLEVLEVDSGTVARAHLSARPDRFRAAILDIVMSGTPVAEVVAAIRAVRPRFPFLLISGLATPRLVDGMLALGGVGFLRKPFTREELFASLRDLFTIAS